jgi:hypothetical protein
VWFIVDGSPGYRPGFITDDRPGNGAGYVLASWLVTVLVIEMVNVCGSSLMAALVTVLAGNTEKIQRKYRAKE